MQSAVLVLWWNIYHVYELKRLKQNFMAETEFLQPFQFLPETKAEALFKEI